MNIKLDEVIVKIGKNEWFTKQERGGQKDHYEPQMSNILRFIFLIWEGLVVWNGSFVFSDLGEKGCLD